MPPDGHADRRDDQGGDGGRTGRSGGPPAEGRDLEEYYVALYRAALTEKTVAAREAAAEEQAAYEKWEKKTEEFRWMWSEYQRRLAPGERPPVDRSKDPPGSWHGEGDRFLKSAENDQVEAACDRIAELERDKITPAMREVESQDPDRHLVLQRHFVIMRVHGLVGGSGRPGRWPDAGVASGTSAAAWRVRPVSGTAR